MRRVRNERRGAPAGANQGWVAHPRKTESRISVRAPYATGPLDWGRDGRRRTVPGGGAGDSGRRRIRPSIRREVEVFLITRPRPLTLKIRDGILRRTVRLAMILTISHRRREDRSVGQFNPRVLFFLARRPAVFRRWKEVPDLEGAGGGTRLAPMALLWRGTITMGWIS